MAASESKNGALNYDFKAAENPFADFNVDVVDICCHS